MDSLSIKGWKKSCKSGEKEVNMQEQQQGLDGCPEHARSNAQTMPTSMLYQS